MIRLPIAKSGREALQPYGYDLFLNPQPGLAPVTSTPVPADYVIGPDDVLEVQLYGSQNYTLDLHGQPRRPHQLPAARLDQCRWPALQRRQARPRGARGKADGRRARQRFAWARPAPSMCSCWARPMFPGTYTVSGLATVTTTALFAAGGVKPQGSLRHIQVRRQGTLVREFDLYDLLMRGDSSADVKLLPGDVVMVPSVGPTASAYGEVQRPAIYELKGPTDVAQLIDMAGGLTPEADNATASLLHVNAAAPAGRDRRQPQRPGGPGAAGGQRRRPPGRAPEADHRFRHHAAGLRLPARRLRLARGTAPDRRHRQHRRAQAQCRPALRADPQGRGSGQADQRAVGGPGRGAQGSRLRRPTYCCSRAIR